MKNKTVAVVGNASYLKNSNLGQEIDNHHIVVRINLSHELTKMHAKDIGTRTDVVYLCIQLYNSKQLYSFPKHAKIVKKYLKIPNRMNKQRYYYANTGIVAIIDYALQGYTVNVYGMDFYAGAFNGEIPEPHQESKYREQGLQLKIKTSDIYIDGYSKKEYLNKPHFGGIDDLKLLLRYCNYPINFDAYMATVIENNKHKLIDNNMAKKKIDVVIPLGKGSQNDDLDLRYCLRSLEKNFLTLGNVFLVGHKPKWVKGVIHIPCDDPNQRNKDANIIRKVVKACSNKKLREDFLFVSDDQLVVNPIEEPMIMNDGDMRGWLETLGLNTRWKIRYRNTALKFSDSINFETHTPQPYKKSEFVELPKLYPDIYKEGQGYIINSLYFNHYKYKSDRLSKNYKLELRNDMPLQDIFNIVKGKLYLSHAPKGFTGNLIKYLETVFADKSKFEKD